MGTRISNHYRQRAVAQKEARLYNQALEREWGFLTEETKQYLHGYLMPYVSDVLRWENADTYLHLMLSFLVLPDFPATKEPLLDSAHPFGIDVGDDFYHQYTFNLGIMGYHYVGKTTLLAQMALGEDDMGNIQDGQTLYRTFKTSDGTLIETRVTDFRTSGFRTQTSRSYRELHGVILVYDVQDQYTFAHLSGVMSEIERFASENTNLIIVGNKIDAKCSISSLRDTVETEMGKDFANKFGIPFIEVSALMGTKVDEAFGILVHEIWKRFLNQDLL